MSAAKITSEGQITLPKNICEHSNRANTAHLPIYSSITRYNLESIIRIPTKLLIFQIT